VKAEIAGKPPPDDQFLQERFPGNGRGRAFLHGKGDAPPAAAASISFSRRRVFQDRPAGSANFPAGGRSRFPAVRLIDFVGQMAMQLPQAKQSGITRSRFRIAPMTVEGQAFSQARQAMQVS